jgi:hypothetical protein
MSSSGLRIQRFAAFLLPSFALVAGTSHCSGGGPTSADEAFQTSSAAATTSGGSSSGGVGPHEFADVYLTNQTPWPLQLTNGTIVGSWSAPASDSNPCQTVPGGAPPGIAPPNNAQVAWGSFGLGAGSITVSALDVTGLQPVSTVIGTLQWSASQCSSTWQPASTNPFGSSPFNVQPQLVSSALNRCVFRVEVGGGPTLQSVNRTASLTTGQAIAAFTESGFSIGPWSADGTTNLRVEASSPTECSVVAWNNSSGNTTTVFPGAVMGIMEGSGNFVAYGIDGKEASTGTSGPGAWLEVDSGLLRVVRTWVVFGHAQLITLWQKSAP